MSFKPTKSFKIVPFNCNGLKSSISYISKLLVKNDIIFLSEHWLQVGEISSVIGIFSDGVCFLKSSVNPEVVLKGRPYGGVGFICRMLPGIIYKQIECHSDRIHGIQIISNHKVILTVYSVYMLYENHSKEQLELYMDTLDKLQSMLDDSSAKTPILHVGDVNTVLPQTTELNNLWYKKRPFSYRSYLLFEFLYENDLIVANFHFTQDKNFTFQGGYQLVYRPYIFTHVYVANGQRLCYYT